MGHAQKDRSTIHAAPKENESSLLECAVGTGWRQAGCVIRASAGCGDRHGGNKKGSRSCLSHGHRRGDRHAAFGAVLVAVPGGFGCVALPELLDAPGGIDDLLLARIERVARRANFHMQRLVDRRAGRECVATTARDLDFAVIR